MVINEIKIKTKGVKKTAAKIKPTVKVKKTTGEKVKTIKVAKEKKVLVSPSKPVETVVLAPKTSLVAAPAGKIDAKITPGLKGNSAQKKQIAFKKAAPSELVNLQPSVKTSSVKNISAIRQAILNELTQPAITLDHKESTIKEKVEQIIKPVKTAKAKNTAKAAKQQLKKQIITEEAPNQEPIKVKSGSGKLKIFIAIDVFLVLIIGLAANIYFCPLNSLSKIAGNLLPVPIVSINGQTIKLSDFQDDYSALEKYSERQDLPFTQAELKKRVKESMIERAILDNLAQKESILITTEEIGAQLNSLLAENQTIKDVAGMIKQLYGWELQSYEQKILKPLLQAKKLNDAFADSHNQPEIKEALNNFLIKIKEDPKQFNIIASSVNEDSSRYTSGDLGWMLPAEASPEYQLAISELKTNEVSDVVETASGYHLIKMLEKNISEDDQNIYHLAHIFLKKPQFSDYLTNEIKKAKIISFIKI